MSIQNGVCHICWSKSWILLMKGVEISDLSCGDQDILAISGLLLFRAFSIDVDTQYCILC